MAFDLADRLQTPIFVMLDLDIGMNEWLCKPLAWDDGGNFDRGKVLTAAELDAGREFARYLDVDGDGIPYRTIPGTHPNRGTFFTRGTSRNRYARYSEDGADYVDNMDRLLKKFETAKVLVPAPVERRSQHPTRYGVIYFGSTTPSMHEALEGLEAEGIHLDLLRIRAFPFADSTADFVSAHDRVFVVEQNRDGQLRALLINECELDPARLIRILHYDGTPITARFIRKAIAEQWRSLAGLTQKDAAE
jgi:2-oxoglutarate ferredoxin oxidoreductase subunit alpha